MKRLLIVEPDIVMGHRLESLARSLGGFAWVMRELNAKTALRVLKDPVVFGLVVDANGPADQDWKGMLVKFMGKIKVKWAGRVIGLGKDKADERLLKTVGCTVTVLPPYPETLRAPLAELLLPN